MSELRLNTDGHIIKFGADNDVSLTHVADTGLLLNSTMQLQFNDSSQFINAPSATVLDINATDEIELNATAVDLNGTLDVSGTLTQTGVATFSARSVHSSGITIADAGQIGSASDADAIAIASNGVVTFSQNPVFPDGGVAVADLDIDGATDIGAAIVDADLFIIDDGAGGTNRKVTASRLKTYAGFDVSSITGATALTVDPASDDEYIINNGGTLNRVDYKHVSNSGKFLVYDAAVTVANATGTIVTGWSESIDVDGLFASNKYTPTVPGYYYFGATIRADNPGATARINMGIRKNGSALPSGSFDAETNAVSASYPSVNTSGISYADGDDYFEVHIYHNIGSSHDFFDVGFWGFKLS